MQVNIPVNFEPRWYQLKLFQALDGVKNRPETKKRRAFLRWHRRAGKDKACWCYLVKEAAEVPGNYFYVFPTAAEGKKALWENVDLSGFKMIYHLPLDDKDVVTRVNNQEMAIMLKNGSTVRVIGLDHNIDAIRGVAAKGCVFSEFAYQNPEAYKVIMPSLRQAKGWAIFNSTPAGFNFMYEFEQNIKKSKNWYVSILQTMWPDEENYSGLFTPEELEEIKMEEGYTQEDMEREYGASYVTGMKGAYYAKDIEKAYTENRVGHFEYDSNKLVDTFWDLGIGDSTAVWFRQLDGNRIIWVDFYENDSKGIQHYVQMLKEKGYVYRTHFIPHDGHQRTFQTGTSTEDLFRKYALEYGISDDICVVKRQPLQAGINATRSRMNRYFFDSEACSEGIKKLSLYRRQYDRGRNVYTDTPVKDGNDHAADAIRTEALATEFHSEDNDALPQFRTHVITDYKIFD